MWMATQSGMTWSTRVMANVRTLDRNICWAKPPTGRNAGAGLPYMLSLGLLRCLSRCFYCLQAKSSRSRSRAKSERSASGSPVEPEKRSKSKSKSRYQLTIIIFVVFTFEFMCTTKHVFTCFGTRWDICVRRSFYFILLLLRFYTTLLYCSVHSVCLILCVRFYYKYK